ncbi:MAG: LysR family transcriptional regulator [Gammaproteobacteria bacterium]
MSDRRLQVFYEVARHLSFTKAAEILEMTQPAVTFQIRQLEEQYKARFFDRSHNRIDLTDAGRRAFQYTERIFEIYQEMENSLQNVTGNITGVLRIGAGAACAQYHVVKLLTEYQHRFPQVNIQLSVRSAARIVAMVENSDVDLGIVEDFVSTKQLKSEPYANEIWHLVAGPSHPLAKSGRVSPDVLKSQSWILTEEGASTSETIDNFLKTLGIEGSQLKVIMEISSLEAVKTAVQSCQALTILPSAAIEKELASGSLVVIQTDMPYIREIRFLYKEQKFPLLIVEEFLELARQFGTSKTPVPLSREG